MSAIPGNDQTFKPQKNLAAASAISFAIKLFGAVLSYGMVVVLAHLLSTEEYGRFAFGLNAAIILSTVGNMGFSTGIMRFWPKFLVTNEVAAAKGTVHLAFRSALMGGVLVGVFCVLGTLLANFFGIAADVATAAVIATLALTISLGDTATNLLRAQGSTLLSMLPRDVLWRLLIPALSYGALRAGLGLTGTGALAISAGILLVLDVWQGQHIQRYLAAIGSAAPAYVSFNSLRATLVPLWLIGVIYAMIQQFDVVIVGTLLGKAEAGPYFAAQKTAQLLSLVLIAGGMVTAPTMAALYHAHKLQELQALCRKLALAIAAVTAAGFAVLIVAGKLLLGVFDPAFVAAYPILLIIGFGAVIDAMSGPNAYLMQMTRFEWPYVKVMVATYGVVIVAQILLIPHFGAIGAALASAGGVIMWNVASIIILRRHAGLDPSLIGVFANPKPGAKVHD